MPCLGKGDCLPKRMRWTEWFMRAEEIGRTSCVTYRPINYFGRTRVVASMCTKIDVLRVSFYLEGGIFAIPPRPPRPWFTCLPNYNYFLPPPHPPRHGLPPP